MIRINGSPASYDGLASRYPTGGIESVCLKILSSSGYTYSYSAIGALDFELAMRKEIINAASKLLNSGLNFEVFRSSYANSRYWIRTRDGGFDLLNNAQPSAAIRDIFTNGRAYGTECATAMQIVYFGALLAVIGDTAFDRVCRGISLMNWHKLSRIFQETGLMQQYPDYLPGDRRYFANPDVNLMAPEWQGENVIDMGDGSYYGHGVGRYTGPQIIADLNQNRRPGATRSAYLMDSAGRPDFEKLYQAFR